MKAVVLSDSHRNFSSIQDILEQEKDAQLIIHAGDVQSDVDDILEAYPRTACAYVRGNNDFAVLNVPYDRFFSLGDTKIFLTHGHRYGVKQDLFRLFARARELGGRHLHLRAYPYGLLPANGRNMDAKPGLYLAVIRRDPNGKRHSKH